MNYAYKLDFSKYTDEQILKRAIKEGYKERIIQEGVEGEENDAEAPTSDLIDNPQTPTDFIVQEFKKMADAWVAISMIADLEEQIKVSRIAGIEQIKGGIAATSSIVEVE
jgi:hypothetical protein